MEYPTGAERGGNNQGSNPGQGDGFPDYVDSNGDGYPENDNRYKLVVGYRTGHHAGSSVPITAEGAGALLFTGYFDQTDVFFKMARALGDTRVVDKATGAAGRGQALEARRIGARRDGMDQVRDRLQRDI